jgi:molybdopterin converting factor subunit 1
MRLLFFAHLRQIVGQEAIEVSVPEPVTSDALWGLLTARFPALSPFKSSVRLAKNCEYATANTRFSNADEVALIPPVSGG